jgi:hypothetical protein
MATVTRRPDKGLRGVDKQQDSLQDNRVGPYDPVPGADVRGEPIPANTGSAHALPEGLKRGRKGPLNKTTGRR